MTKKPNKNCKVGDVVRIVFDDHSEGEQHIVFEVFGRVLRKDRRAIVLASWKYADSNEVDDNITQWTILRAGIRLLEVWPVFVPIVLEDLECPKKQKTTTELPSQSPLASSVNGATVPAKVTAPVATTLPPQS